MTVPLQLFGKTGSLQLANDGRLKNVEKNRRCNIQRNDTRITGLIPTLK
jgi:hypothetical protein